MLSRREVLRTASLVALAVGAGQASVGCGSESGGREGGVAGLEYVGSDVRRAAGDAGLLPAAVASLHALGAGLYGELASAGDNLGLSPYSVGVALGMTANGAAGATRDEMLAVLGASSTARLNGGLNALTADAEGLGGRQGTGRDAPEILLAAANQLFGQRGVDWERDFLDALARDYSAGMRVVDFVRATEAARASVNEWTAERTRGRIEKILPPGSVDALTRLVLVNALYFKAAWAEEFEEALTRDADFHLANGTTVQVPTMRAVLGSAAAGRGDGWTAVRLPYVGGRLAMTIVLADAGREADLEATITAGGLDSILSAPRPGGVDLALPRWTFRTAVPLKETLSALGMPTAFQEGRADFSGMTTSDQPLLIDDVYHQVFVAVDEKGTEAAAATAVVVGTTSAVLAETRVVVDRPFVFAIHDVEHGTPLFIGRVADPRS